MENFCEKSSKELLQNLKEAEDTLFNLRMKKCSAALDKSHMVNFLRKQIARMKTFLKQKACQVGNK
ncbi:MAG: 50S ribosomal protein L29 [Puniceicoccales bacterium]|jgi:ribosomal protein L29|nr:50S ribosomal protein L29 [Puniceicoccales bacterium]